jgi:hypothetical protein
MAMRDHDRNSVLPTLVAAAPEVPTLHILSSVLDAAQAAIRLVWGENEAGELCAPPPYEQEAELARAVLARISELADAVRHYREAILWRVPDCHHRPDLMDRSLSDPRKQPLSEVDDQLF